MHVGNVDNGLQEMIKWILKISCLSLPADKNICDNNSIEQVMGWLRKPLITFQSNKIT